MADFTSEERHALVASLRSIAEADPEVLEKRELGTPASFSAIRGHIDDAISLASLGMKHPDALLAWSNSGREAIDATTPIKEAFEWMRTFRGDPSSAPGWSGQRSNILTQLPSWVAQLRVRIGAPIAFDAVRRAGFDVANAVELRAAVAAALADTLRKFEERVAPSIAEHEALMADAARDTTAIADLLESAKKAAAQAVVSKEARHFAKLAEDHSRAARRWLVATAVLSSAAIGTAVWLLGASVSLERIGGLSSGAVAAVAIARYALSRLAILSILFYAITVAGRNYAAHRHNHVVNTHRATALSTFETFVQSGREPQVRDEILRRAAETIFSAQPSAYLTTSADPAPQNTFVDVARSYSGKNGS